MKNIVITGGSGMIGQRLTELLTIKGYNVAWLSRTKDKKDKIPKFKWRPSTREIEEKALEDAHIIVHLAGANIAKGRWTQQQKQKIKDSRIQSAQLIFDKIKAKDTPLDAFISASAIGYYGAITSEKIFSEEDRYDQNDFLSVVCHKWEQQAKQFTDNLNIRSVCIRTGVVLSRESDLIKKAMLPTRFGLGAPLGKGYQYVSWIHIDDLCHIYIKAIEDTAMRGVYNAVAPAETTNTAFMKTIATAMKKPFFLPPIPEWIFKLFLGEAAQIILEGSRTSSQKIEDAGYKFEHANLKETIEYIMQN